MFRVNAVPEMVAEPSPLLWKVRPLGSFRPIIESDGIGTPVVLMVNENCVPATTLAVARLVNEGDVLFTALNWTGWDVRRGAAVGRGARSATALFSLREPDVARSRSGVVARVARGGA